ncbi:hypothetical protein [Pseudodesulfovibrio sp. zrk46]|uniref:hypothetical protein n=1 Tax=Pseudodesulfovibrio sp. zrk46 TaxID=2725288 RepID=UPI001449741D|nr:hypothetical protein [Pseudodesulfovibrio sp. zrk46]QJB57696.1 hypothetical protein HFN16_15345 [Pseudodesulfovibrio sp. zrk46]
MSSIAALESMSEYAPNRYEEKREDVEPVKDQPREEIQTPVIQAAAEQQDQKNTMNAFQYTGKGSFIDKVF